MIVNEGASHLVSHRDPAVVVLHVDRQLVGALVIPGLHFVELRRHHTVSYLRYFLLALQLVLLIGSGEDGEDGFFAGVSLERRHHGVLLRSAIVLRLRHLRLGLHGSELKDALRLGFVEVEVLFSVEEGLTHVHLVGLIVSGGVEFEADVTLVLRLGVVGWEVVVGLESLIVRIDLLDIRSCLLKIEIYKTFQAFIHVVNSE